MNIEEILHHYLVCALWSTPGYMEKEEDDLEALDEKYDVEDVAESFRSKSASDIEALLGLLNSAGIELNDESQFGHDFWLTRNGHGAGFWDGDWDTEEDPELGEKITAIVKANFGTVDLYISNEKVEAA